MKKRGYIFIFLITAIFLGTFREGYGQRDDDKNWYMGFQSGTNLSKVGVRESYTVLESIREGGETVEKFYPSWKHPGLRIGMITEYYVFPFFSVSLQPNWMLDKYAYEIFYHWQDPENKNNNIDQEYAHRQNIHYLDVPLFFNLHFKFNKFKPFLHFGGYYGVIMQANKAVHTQTIGYGGGIQRPLLVDDVIIGFEDQLAKYRYGLVGGGGITYDIQSWRMGLEINYRYGLSNMANENNRYINQQITSGYYDVQDDFKIDHLTGSIKVIIPLDDLVHVVNGPGVPN